MEHGSRLRGAVRQYERFYWANSRILSAPLQVASAPQTIYLKLRALRVLTSLAEFFLVGPPRQRALSAPGAVKRAADSAPTAQRVLERAAQRVLCHEAASR